MDVIDYNPHHTDLEWNEDQSATPRIVYYYAAPMFQLLFGNITPPHNMELSDYNPIPTTLYTGGRKWHEGTAEYTHQNNQSYRGNWGAWLAVVTVYLGVCGFLLELAPLMFPNDTQSRFQTHLGFIIMAIASLYMVLITSGIVVYTNNNLESLMKEHFSPFFEVILKSLFWFSAINTPLSLLLLLFIPRVYNWTGYGMVCALFLAIIAVKYKCLKRLLAANRTNNLGAFEMV